MRRELKACAISLAVLAGCGLENVFNNAGHDQYDRPASKVTGAAGMVTNVTQLSVIDGDGNAVAPFLSSLNGTDYELRLPSSKYSMLRVRADVGNMELRSILPAIGEESAVGSVDLDARNMTETLITEARLSADGDTLKKVTADAYVGTRNLIRAALDTPGPTQDLLNMVQRFLEKFDASLSVPSPNFFNVPVFCTMDADETCTDTPVIDNYVVKASAVDNDFLARNPFDYVGDGTVRHDSTAFDAKLAEVAQLYRPAGCPDPKHIRLVFTVDFNEGAKNGNCGSIDRFKWAKDKPGKSMFFVGWIYDGSAGLQPSDFTATNPECDKLLEEDACTPVIGCAWGAGGKCISEAPAVAVAMGSSTPNTIPMYDDGTNGDQTAGDNIWSIYLDVPRASPGHVLRIGYKYTWGTSGAPWTGSEEWPGNSRILEVVDDNGDNFVYRRDVFGDEATNKDKSNLNLNGTGSIDWTTDLHGCSTPESHENKYDDNSCKCGAVVTPKWIGARTVTCTQ